MVARKHVAVFTDNDFDKVNGVTTTLRAVLAHAPAGPFRYQDAVVAHDEGVHEAWAREVVEFVSDETGAVRAVVVRLSRLQRPRPQSRLFPLPPSLARPG